ncbi:MAG: ABC transporter permease [Akkermansia sp.]|nr:ABC transporter permease [Akkermansia sp.]MBR5875520.1 ABC transporter permease [Akkermansia sp.]
MTKLLLRRLGQGVLVIFVLETITFFLVRMLPGNPFLGERKLPQHVMEQLNALYGLNQSGIVQYFNYWKGILLQGDFGPSLVREGLQVSQIIAEAFPVSLALGVVGMLIAIIIGIPAGMLSACYRNRWPDTAIMLPAMLGICIPAFVVGPVFGKTLGTLPGLSVAGWDSALCIVLPALTLGLINAAYLARLTRGGMLEVLSQEYIRTARAKGASGPRVMFIHALRSGLLPAVSYLGPAFAALITGSFVVETCFQVPGMGLHFVNATTDRDYFLIQGLVLCYGILIVVANLVVDLVLVALNPRLRSQGAA